MDKPLPALSGREWEIMRCCWRLGKTTTHDVLREISKRGEVEDYRTTQEFLRRCAVKGYLAITKVKNTNFYEPVADRDRALREVIDRFLDHTLEGDPEDLAVLDQALGERLTRRKRAKRAS